MKGRASNNSSRQPKGGEATSNKALTIILSIAAISVTVLAGTAWSNAYTDPSYFVAVEDLKVANLERRLQYLETKLNAYLAFTSDPYLANNAPAKCNKSVDIKSIACEEGAQCAIDNQNVCLDTFPVAGSSDIKSEKKSCIVYDFGIRESPEYGLAFAKPPFDCEVVGFDPSPISVTWWKDKGKEIQAKYPGYSFHAVGAAGHDGSLELREYDWGQVSIIQFPTRTVDVTQCLTDGQCKYHKFEGQKKFLIPVKTLSTIMKELGHKRINLMKIDVEGGEYTFLEKMIDDLSCRRVDQINLEWHHYDHDIRYGVTSSPQRNVLVALLRERCGLEQFWVHPSKGWPSNQKMYTEMGLTLYYTLTSFKRTRWEF